MLKVQIEIELSDHDVQVLADISKTPGPVRPMFGTWADRAAKLRDYSLVKIERAGVFMKYSLTEQGESALRQSNEAKP